MPARKMKLFPHGDPLPFRAIQQITPTKDWDMQLPVAWIDNFRADPPSVMTAAPGRVLNLYPSTAIHAKYPRRPESPSGVAVNVRADGSFRIPPDLRPRGLNPPGDKFALIGCGHSIRIVPYEYVTRLLSASGQDLNVPYTRQR
jgi:hypothetical protein